MATQCFPLVGGKVMRVTRLDACGRPVFGECASVVSDGFVSIELSAVVDEGDAIDVKNAAGNSCVTRAAKPKLSGYTVNLNFCKVDPDLYALTTNQEVVIDPFTGDTIGFNIDIDIDLDSGGFALEVWSEVPGVACSTTDLSAQGANGYILLPWLSGGVFGDFTIENDAVSFVVQNSATKSGSGWGVGPYNVMYDATGDPAPLALPIGPSQHIRTFLSFIAPPVAGCGCRPVDNPASPNATVGVAGIPGHFTPVPSKRPATLALLQASAITASPTTAWTVDQFVQLLDGSLAHWSGTAWVAGPA